MDTRFATLVWTVALAGFGVAQVDPVRAEIEAIDGLIAKERNEDAAGKARRLLQQLDSIDDEAYRAELRGQIDKLIGRADSLAKRHDTAVGTAVDTLVEFAKQRETAGWYSAALSILELVAELDPSAVAFERARLEAQIAKAGANAKGVPVSLDWLQGEPVEGGPGWTLGVDAIQSPPLTGEYHLLLSATRMPARIQMQGEVVVDEAREFAGFAFAYRNLEDYYAVWVRVTQSGGRWKLMRSTRNRFAKVAEGGFAAKLPAGKGITVPIAIDTSDGRVHVRILGKEVDVVTLPKPLQPGYVGTIGGHLDEHESNVRFQSIEARAFGAVASAKPAEGGEFDDRLEAIAQSVTDGHAESGVVALWHARGEAAVVENASQRRKRVGSVDKLLDQHDPLAKTCRAARVKAAKALLPVAQAYVRNKWFATGLELLEIASRIDHKTAARALGQARSRAGNVSKKKDAITEYFSRRFVIAGGDPWTLRKGVISSPKLEESTEAVCTHRVVGPGTRIRVETKLGDKKSKTALVFGCKEHGDSHAYYIFELYFWDGFAGVELLHWVPGQKLKVLDRTMFHFSKPERAEWVELTVELGAKRIRCRAADRVWLETEPVRNEEPRGNFGFFVSGDAPFKDPVHFRNLRLEKFIE